MKETPHLTNETVFDLITLPEHLIVIGAGPQGLELAQSFHRLGSSVTVLDAGPPLAREDEECAQVVVDELAREGVSVRARVAIVRVEAIAAGVQAIVRSDEREASPQ